MAKKEFRNKLLSKGRTFSFLSPFPLCIIISIAIISSSYDTLCVHSVTINKHVLNQTICDIPSTNFSNTIVPPSDKNNRQSSILPQRCSFLRYNGENVSDAISDSIVLSKKMSIVELTYWNIFTKI